MRKGWEKRRERLRYDDMRCILVLSCAIGEGVDIEWNGLIEHMTLALR